MLSGLNKSDLIIIAARPGMGKTALQNSIALTAARRYDKRVAMFNLEMSGEQLLQRMIAAETRIDSQRLRRGDLGDHEWAIFLEALGRLSESRIFIDDTPSITPMQLRTKCRRLYAEHGLDLVMIDYLQLMQAEHPSNNRVQEVSEISRELKGLARELDVPVVAAAQLSRAVEQRQNKRPVLSDLRDSGCLTGDTLVTLADTGERVPMRALAGRSGFAVWALNPSTYRIERALATNAFLTGVRQTYRLKTRLGRTIRATGNHLFLTIGRWQQLDELAIGTHIALPRQLAAGNEQSLSNSELALLGHLIGDGCTLPRHAIQYTTNEPKLAEIVSSLATDVFGPEVEPRIKQERTWYQVYLRSTRHHTHGTRSPVSEWLDSLGIWGLRSHEKHVPEELFKQDAFGIARFLRHLWSTDGCIRMTWGKSPRPALYYATSSERLARDVQSLLLRLEITATLKCVSQNEKGRPQYQAIVTGKSDVIRFAERVGAAEPARLQRLHEIVAHIENREENTNRDVIPQPVWDLHVRPSMQAAGVTHRALYAGIGASYGGMTILNQNLSRDRAARVARVAESTELQALAESDIYWDQIASIELDAVEEVFDLTVPGPHNFIANDIIVHNSIEQDADVVMFIYRDDYYNTETSERPNIAEVHVAKHRNGPTGGVDLFWHGKLAAFRNLHRQEIEL
jgi:replicative DNA helicase